MFVEDEWVGTSVREVYLFEQMLLRHKPYVFPVYFS